TTEMTIIAQENESAGPRLSAKEFELYNRLNAAGRVTFLKVLDQRTEKGWKEGKKIGKEGRKVGREEGRKVGREEGRKEERKRGVCYKPYI
ncbi:1390_t:CDS:2, partial [Paraglomus occultum]